MTDYLTVEELDRLERLTSLQTGDFVKLYRENVRDLIAAAREYARIREGGDESGKDK